MYSNYINCCSTKLIDIYFFNSTSRPPPRRSQPNDEGCACEVQWVRSGREGGITDQPRPVHPARDRTAPCSGLCLYLYSVQRLADCRVRTADCGLRATEALFLYSTLYSAERSQQTNKLANSEPVMWPTVSPCYRVT